MKFFESFEDLTFSCTISFNTLCDQESRIFLQTTVSTQQGCNIGLNYGFIRIFLNISGANCTVIKEQKGMFLIDKVDYR